MEQQGTDLSERLVGDREEDGDNSGLEVGGSSSKERAERLLHSRRCLSFMCVGVVFSLLVAIALPILIESQLKDGIRSNVVIDSEKATGFKQFENRGKDGANFMEFYFFNITNPHQVLEGAKPHVEELGPFVYTMYQVRGDFEWDKENDTLAYREHSFYVFDRDQTFLRTKGRFQDDKVRVTTLNMLFFGMEALVGKAYWHMICDHLLWKNDFDRLFSRQTVLEYLTGYSAHIDLHFAKIPIQFPGLYPNTTRDKDPNWQSKTVMRVGEKDLNQVYEILIWRGMEHVQIECPWGANPLPGGQFCPGHFPCCKKKSLAPSNDLVPVWGTAKDMSVWDWDANLVHGRNGEQFAPGVKKGQELIIFNDIIWRALRFKNLGGKEVFYRGIKMLRFTPDETTFMNATQHPPNARYYMFGPHGLLGNLSMIEQGCELFASLPHFLGADPALVQAVEGLSPDHDKHSMFIDVEPILGQTMIEHVRAQVNGQLSRGEKWGFDNWFPNVRDNTLVPIAWFDQVSIINDEGVAEFKQIYIAQTAQRASVIIGSIGTVLFLGPLFYAFRLQRKQNQPGDVGNP